MSLTPDVPVRKKHVVDFALESGCTAVLCRCLVDIDHFGFYPTRVRRQQQYAIGDLDRFGNRMGHEYYGELRVFPELQEFVLHLPPGQSVESGERLVHQQYVRLHRHAARDCDALLHAARKRVGVAVDSAGQLDLLDVSSSYVLSFFSGQLAGSNERKHHVLDNGFPGHQLIEFLEDHHAIRPGLGDRLSVYLDRTADRLHIAADSLQEGGFAAARRTEKDEAV